MGSRSLRFRADHVCFIVFVASALIPACARGTAELSTDDLATIATDVGAGACAACPAGYVCSSGQCVSPDTDADHDGFAVKDDCDDHDPNVHRGAVEVCNGKDDDCNGKIDEGFDLDGDGWPSCAVLGKSADCDDKDPLVKPGAFELCNGKDDNCDGKIDEGFDKDNDGFFSCAPKGVPADCDDDDAKVNPGASEQCNGKDDDCDGKVDELPAKLSGSLTSPPDPHWVVVGSATFRNGWAQLTPDQTYAAGALWWNATYLFDTFEVTGTFSVSAKSDCADGVAFAWVPGSNVSAVGGGGGGYGAMNLGGYAVAIDTLANPNEPVAPFLVLLDGRTGAHLFRQSVHEVRDGQGHELRVKLDAGRVSVWLDSVSYVFQFPIPEYVPFTGHWGFTAGTGDLTSVQSVKNVSMFFPNGQGCVP